MKKIISLMLAFVIVAALGTGCSPKPSVASGDASKGGDIKVWLASTPETVDPALNSSMDGANYIIHLSQGLFRYKWDATGVEPGDAASYTVSDDGLVWTFTLRDDIKWSDGQKITAKDYEYSWKRFCDPNTAAPYAEDISVFIENGLEVLEGSASLDELGVKAISDDVLEVRLAGPCPFFDEIAVFPVLYPVRQDMIEANGATWWQNPETNISNGPFKLKSFTLEGEMVIVPNENYYDVAEVVPGSISFKFLADDIAAHNAILAGEIDISNQTPPEEIAAMKEKGMFFPKEQLGTYYISFNIEKEPFDNPLVRKALTLAIDRQYLGDEVTQGSYGPITAMVGKGFNDVESGKDFRDVGGNFIELDHEANKAEAKKALAEAGYPDGEGFPAIEYMYNSTTVLHKAVAEFVAKSWEEVLNVKVDLSAQEWGVFLDSRRKGNYEMARNGWVSDWNDPSSMLTIFVSGGGNNDGNYLNPKFDEFMKESYATSDREARMTALHNAEKVLMDDWACAPLMQYRQNFTVSEKLKDWTYLSIGYTMFHKASISE